MDGREETCDEILVERFVLTHLVDGVPLGRRHSLLDGLRGDVLALEVVAAHALVRRQGGASLRRKEDDFIVKFYFNMEIECYNVS